MTLSTGQILDQRYRISGLLGEGGFGAVYRAWDLNVEGQVAVKECLATDPERLRQFQTEAALLFKLRHTNLPVVHDFFNLPGQGSYLVMDYIEGQDLKAILKQAGGPLPEAQASAWIGQICDALAYLHSQSPPIIHRDIKPANIRITTQGKAILVDFGIAKVYDPALKTTRGAQAATPAYAPPEQFGVGSTDARSDIYALGATAYHLLTGMAPPTSMDVTAGSAPPPQPVRQLNPLVSPAASQAVERAMQLHREQRFSSASQFKAALQPPSSKMVAPPLGPVAAVQAATYDETQGAGRDIPQPVAAYPPQPDYTYTPSGRGRQSSQTFSWAALVGLAVLGLCLLAGVTGLVLSWYFGPPGGGPPGSLPASATPKPNTTGLPGTTGEPGATSPVVILPTNTPLPTSSFPPTALSPALAPDDFVRAYYQAINERNYEQSWSMLSESFKERVNPTGFDPYAEWWDRLASVEVLKAEITQQGDGTARVEAKLRYTYKNGREIDDNAVYDLVTAPTESGWWIDGVQS